MTDDRDEPDDATGIWARSTAPQSEFTTARVGTGVVVLAAGLLVTVALPLLLA